jgi:3-deoxy-D-manno-octulosonic-acid transferase
MISIYNILWTVAVLCSLPVILLMITAGKKRVMERFALSIPYEAVHKKRIWIHALSVGEVISALTLIREMGIRYPGREIVFTVTTSKGLEIARKETSGIRIIPMPLDFWWCVRRMVKHINPFFFVLVETDIWPCLINYLRRKNIKCFLVNGRVSPGTFGSYRKFSFFVRPLLNRFTLCMMQSELDAKRLLDAGVEPGRILTTGNIKFDKETPPMQKKERDDLLKKLHLDPQDEIWVAGSVHKDEDMIILEVFSRLVRDFPGLRLILAPRNIEESGAILKKALDIGLKSILKTDLKGATVRYNILILNTMGELGRIYGISKISFVGGSMVPLGGHNLLEPAGFGCPVIFGRHMHNFVLMSELLLHEKGGFQVVSGDELFASVKMLLQDPDLCDITGKAAKRFSDKHKGALKEVLKQITRNID